MSGKPYLQFYKGDWLRDPALSRCSPATRGIYVDLLCAMDDMEPRGSIHGSFQELSRMTRCTPSEFEMAARELAGTNTLDAIFSDCDNSATCHANEQNYNADVTLTNRRMFREDKTRKFNAQRQKRLRETKKVTSVSHGSNAVSSYSSSSSSSDPPEIQEDISKSEIQTSHPPDGGNDPSSLLEKEAESVLEITTEPDVKESRFMEFWVAYPKCNRKQAKVVCRKFYGKNVTTQERHDQVLNMLAALSESEDWLKEGGRYIPAPLVWLHREPWGDDPDEIKPVGPPPRRSIMGEGELESLNF